MPSRIIPDPLRPVPVPATPALREGYAELASTRLWYTDAGGEGEPVIFLHPAASGDARIWAYQIPALINGGYRFISYARRGYFKSNAVDPASPGNAADDLRDFIQRLGLRKAHIVASGAGGSVAADHALSNPDQILTLAITSNYAGVRGGPIREAAERARPPQWNALPRWFREFSTSYVVANPKGVADWVALQEEATRAKGVQQKTTHRIIGATLESLQMPVLLLTGDSDSSTPPSLMRMVARHIRDCELVVVPEAGHSPYWETPDVFNHALIDFLSRRKSPE